MPTTDELLELIPVDDIAKQLGVSESTAEAGIRQVIPTIIGGMHANTQAGGAKSLEMALTKHAPAAGKTRMKLSAINTADGEKIVNNVFGSKKGEVTEAVADSSAGDVTKDLIGKLLPIVAPIVIAFLAQQFLGQKDAPASSTSVPATGGGIGDILGGLLGGSGGSDILGGVLGGLLGGGKK